MSKQTILIKDEWLAIDSNDLDKVNSFSNNQITLVCNKRNGEYYPVIRKVVDGKQKTFLLSRLILGLNDSDKVVTYKDDNPMNLVRSNLIISTKAKSNQSRRKSSGKSSQYKGVSFAKHAKKFAAFIKPSAKSNNIFLGYFDTDILAAQAYNAAAIKHHGIHASLNKI